MPKPSGFIVTTTALIKSALGSGILSGHDAYRSAGFMIALILNIVLGVYMTFCLYILGMNGQIMCKRLGKPFLTYPDLAEAAVFCFPNPKIARWSRAFRYIVTCCICGELFGACATYQLIIAKTIKQLVENTQVPTVKPAYEGYPSMTMYMLIMLVPLILICCLRHLQWLAPFTIVGNVLVLMCVFTTIYYSMKINPGFQNMVAVKDLAGAFRFTGMIVFSMSCASAVMSIENNMKDPKFYPQALSLGMFFIVGGVSAASLFGYNAYLEETKIPITINFPMETLPKILKGAIAVMIFVTHALNFFVPFMLVFSSIKKCHSQEKEVFWEYVYRVTFVTIICFVAVIFPSISDLMGFLGAFLLSIVAFIAPNIIDLLVHWHRPGLGKMQWRLWRAIALLIIGVFLWSCGTAAGQEYKIINNTQEAEDAYDIVAQRNVPKPSGVLVSITAIIKGALGSGILSGHVAYKAAGYMFALPVNVLLGTYMTFCLYSLGMNGQRLCRRLGRPFLTYPELAEASFACFPNPKIARFSIVARHAVTACITLDLFGACATYQLIIAKTIKQLVENTHTASVEPEYPGYPSMKMYLLMMLVPIILICWVRHLQWLAPFTIVANFLVLLAVCTTIYYSMKINPTFSGMKGFTDLGGAFKFTGMIVFSMSCAGIAISIENNMANPSQYPVVISVGMFFVTAGVSIASLFGYNAYLEDSKAPITLNFPMETLPKILKVCIAVMIYVTHALNFFVPFMLVFTSIRTYHNQENIVKWELFYRAFFVCVITTIALVFPSIADLMGFLGAFFLSNLAFVFPNVIDLLVNWHRPGLGKLYWRLWRSLGLFIFGVFLCVCGSAVNANNLVKVFAAK